MIHPDTQVVTISDEVGVGVIATRAIPRGTIVWAQDALDQVFEPGQVEKLPRVVADQVQRYAHIDEQGRFVLCWDAGKLINHSCDPSLRGIGTWFQVARRDIAVGEEITCDYAECNIREQLECRCGGASCRRSVHGSDLLTFAQNWDVEAERLLDDVARAQQPLWPYLLSPSEARALIWRYKPLRSFRELFSGPNP